MTNSTESVDERIARRTQEKTALREQLASLDFDGPHQIQGGGFDAMPTVFGAPTAYAICLTCAAMVRLGDPEESGGRTIERSIRIHRDWHGV